MLITRYSNPRQVVLITCRYEGKDNILTADWHTPLSFQPMMYAVSIGKTRFSLNLIRKSKVFTVNFISKDMKDAAIYCGYHTGKDKDKFKLAGLEKEECERINCPRLKSALAVLECKVIKEIEVGDHFLFIANVVNAIFKKSDKRLFHLYKKNFTTTLDT